MKEKSGEMSFMPLPLYSFSLPILLPPLIAQARAGAPLPAATASEHAWGVCASSATGCPQLDSRQEVQVWAWEPLPATTAVSTQESQVWTRLAEHISLARARLFARHGC